jgi:Mg-chelatase subunit ChlI
MATQAQLSPHLTSARQLLDEVSGDDDAQVKATAALAHAALVVAEQVAAVRLVLSAQAVNGKPAG